VLVERRHQRLRAMSSLPSLRASPSDLSVQPSRKAIVPPSSMKATGRTTTITMAMRMPPSIGPSSPDPGPRFHFDQRPERELGHPGGGGGRAAAAEPARGGLFHRGEAPNGAQKPGVLPEVGERRPLAGQRAPRVAAARVCPPRPPAAAQPAVQDPDLAGHDQP